MSPPDTSPEARTTAVVLFCAMVAFAADFASKSWAVGLHQPIEAGHVALAHVVNDGFVFSSFGGGGVSTRTLVLARLAVLILCAFLAARARLATRERLGVALVVAGGLGNLIDPLIRDGAVVDFIGVNPVAMISRHDGFHVFFNLADVSILLGVALAFPAIRALGLAIQRRLRSWRPFALGGDRPSPGAG